MPWSDRRRLLVALAFVVLGGVSLRIIYFAQLSGSGQLERRIVDAAAYDRAARGVLDGSWPGRQAYYQDPLYPYFLAAVYRWIGEEPAALVVAQMALGVASAVLAGLLAAQLGGWLEALIAGLLLATYPILPLYEGLVLKPTLGVFLTVAGLLGLVVARRRGWPTAAGAGVFLGAACLVRANLLAQIPLALAWLLWPGRSRSGRRRAIGATTCLAGCCLVILPFTLHNLSCGVAVLTTTQAGQNFYTGNNPGNDSGTYRPPRGVRAHPFFEESDFRKLAEQEAGRPLDAIEVSAFWRDKALAWIGAEPMAALRLFVRKLGLMLNHVEVPDNVSFEDLRSVLPMLRYPLPVFWVLLVLAAGGLAVHRWKPASRLLVVSAVLMVVSVAAFFVFARYRLTLVPLLAVFAASVPRGVADCWRRRAFGRLALACLAAGLAFVVTRIDLYRPSQAAVHYNRAVDARDAGDLDEAVREVEAALAEDEALAAALQMKTDLLLQRGRVDEAGRTLERLLPLVQDTPEESRSLVLQGRWQAASARPQAAIESFERALRLEPTRETAAVQAALVERSAGRAEAARRRLESYVEANPEAAGAQHLLGVMQAQSGDFAAAERAFRAALIAAPGDTRALANLARCLERGGRFEEALEVYQQLLEVNPANATARRRVRELSGAGG